MKSSSKSSKAKSLLLQNCEHCYFRALCQMLEFTNHPDGCEKWTVDGPAFDGDDYHSRAYQSIKNYNIVNKTRRKTWQLMNELIKSSKCCTRTSS